MALSPIPVVLVSGFLGAGKTTLMRRLILDAHARGIKVCVIVNEFGAADVDGHILAEANAELLASVTGGCACCAGQDDFHDTLLEVTARDASARPDVVLVETSGLADPLVLLDVLTAPELIGPLHTAALLCVADAGRGEEYAPGAPLAPLLANQLRLANWVLLNKADLAAPPALEQLTQQIHHVAPAAVIVPTRECVLDFDPLWQRVGGNVEDRRSKIEDRRIDDGSSDDVDARIEDQRSKIEDRTQNGAPVSSHAYSHTLFFPIPHPVEREKLEAALAALPPEVWRAKGFVRLRGESELQLVQYTGGGKNQGRFRLAPFYFPSSIPEPPGGIVFIGAHLDADALRAAFLGGNVLKVI